MGKFYGPNPCKSDGIVHSPEEFRALLDRMAWLMARIDALDRTSNFHQIPLQQAIERQKLNGWRPRIRKRKTSDWQPSVR